MIWESFLFIASLQIAVLSTENQIKSYYSRHNEIDQIRFLRTLPDSLADEIEMTVPQILAKYKYPTESHNVVTEDGYILTLHRITGGRNRNATKGSVLVMHGILASSADWIITGTQNGLGYILADTGYDVWLGNARGNRYSRNHTNLKLNSNEFWNFSWHEIGIFDISAMIDYILEATGEEKIFHVAHSQGSTAFYVMCSNRPAYNNKIRAHFSLAPIGFVKHIKSPVLKLLNKGDFFLKNFARLFGIRELLPKDGFISELGQKFCGAGGLPEILCENLLFLICGFDSKQLNTTLLPLILAHVPAGSSVKQFLHYSQEMKSGQFRRYDYGFFGNRKHYGSWLPPSYDLSRINVPIYFFHSKNDLIASLRDVKKLATKLKTVKGNFFISDNRFNHLDFLFGINAPKVLYSKILSLMDRH